MKSKTISYPTISVGSTKGKEFVGTTTALSDDGIKKAVPIDPGTFPAWWKISRPGELEPSFRTQ